MPNVRHIYTERDRSETCFTSSQPSVTRQGFKDECDINVIMARYQATGVIDFVNKHEGSFADVSAIDFQTAQETVARARSAFNDLPSSLRERFENDPAQFLEFVQDDKNRAEAMELGLLRPEAKLPPVPPPPAPPAPPSQT